MGTAKTTNFESFTHNLRSQITPSFKSSEIYKKLDIDPLDSSEIAPWRQWEVLSKYVPNRFDHFVAKDLDIDTQIRLGYIVKDINTIKLGPAFFGVEEATILRTYDKEMFLTYSDIDSMNDGELFIDDFSIKNPLDVAVLKILDSKGITFYWESANWEMLAESYNEVLEEGEEYDFPFEIFRKYESIGEEWRTKLKSTKLSLKPITDHIKKKSTSDRDRLWYLLLLYIHDMPDLLEFQFPEEGNAYINEFFNIVPNSYEYKDYLYPYRNEQAYFEGFVFSMQILDDEVGVENFEYYPYRIPEAYSLFFNKQYWFNNYAKTPLYADNIKDLISSDACYNCLSKYAKWCDIHGTFQSVQRKILRFHNLIKKRNKKHHKEIRQF